MKAVKTKVDERQITVEAHADAKEVEAAFEAAYMSFAQRMGLTPEDGADVEQAALNKLGIKHLDTIVAPDVPRYLAPFAIDKLGLVPAYPPEATTGKPAKRGEGLAFELEVALKPACELSSYDSVEITVPPFSMTDKAVDEQLEQMADYYSEYYPTEPRPAQVGDGCLVNVTATADGQQVGDMTVERSIYQVGSNLFGEDFDARLVGMEAGQDASFEIEHAVDGIPTAVTCFVELLEIRERIRPVIDDAWIRKNAPGVQSLAAFKDLLREQFKKQYLKDYDDLKRQEASAQLAKRYTEPIPDQAIDAMKQNLMNNLTARLAAQGESLDAYVKANGGEQQFGLALAMQAKDSVKQGYALDVLFDHEGLKIDESDILAACAAIDDSDPEAVRRQMELSGCGYMLRESAQRLKAGKWLVENACIVHVENE